MFFQNLTAQVVPHAEFCRKKPPPHVLQVDVVVSQVKQLLIHWVQTLLMATYPLSQAALQTLPCRFGVAVVVMQDVHVVAAVLQVLHGVVQRSHVLAGALRNSAVVQSCLHTLFTVSRYLFVVTV